MPTYCCISGCLQFENSNEIGVFAKLTNAYCLVALGGSENFYRWGNFHLPTHSFATLYALKQVSEGMGTNRVIMHYVEFLYEHF